MTSELIDRYLSSENRSRIATILVGRFVSRPSLNRIPQECCRRHVEMGYRVKSTRPLRHVGSRASPYTNSPSAAVPTFFLHDKYFLYCSKISTNFVMCGFSASLAISKDNHQGACWPVRNLEKGSACLLFFLLQQIRFLLLLKTCWRLRHVWRFSSAQNRWQ